MNSRREFLKRASYIAPAIISLKAAPSFANTGSNRAVEYPFAGLSGECSLGGSSTGDSLLERSSHHFCGE